jgi:hypothetical protein
MNSPLFGLISKAGNASLGELMARSSISASTLAREIADMVRNGEVTLSLGAHSSSGQTDSSVMQNPALAEIMELIASPRSLVDRAESRGESFAELLETALEDDTAASSINVNPTSRGFRFS